MKTTKQTISSGTEFTNGKVTKEGIVAEVPKVNEFDRGQRTFDWGSVNVMQVTKHLRPTADFLIKSNYNDIIGDLYYFDEVKFKTTKNVVFEVPNEPTIYTELPVQEQKKGGSSTNTILVIAAIGIISYFVYKQINK